MHNGVTNHTSACWELNGNKTYRMVIRNARTRVYNKGEASDGCLSLFYTPFSSLCSALHRPVESYVRPFLYVPPSSKYSLFIQKSSFGLNSFVICRSNILASARVQSLYRLL